MERVILCPTASDRDNRSKAMKALREKLPPCPICGKKAYLSHDVFDGADYGYSSGCPAFHLKDGIHGIDDMFSDEKTWPSFLYCDTAKQAFNKWVRYCNKFKEKKE